MIEVEITKVTGLTINAVSEETDAVSELTAKCEFVVTDAESGLHISGAVTKLWEDSYPSMKDSPLDVLQITEDMISVCRDAADQFITSKFGDE